MSRKVELVRLEGDVEALPGPPPQTRPAAEVFRKDNKRMKRPDEDTIKKALEGKTTNFVSEAELQQNKEVYGERLVDGTFSGKTLTEAIIAQREEKDAKYKDIGKQMKQGKNRPLDDDEIHFLQLLADEESAKERSMREQEHKALERMQTARQATVAALPQSGTSVGNLRHKPAAKRHKVVPRAVKSGPQLASAVQEGGLHSRPATGASTANDGSHSGPVTTAIGAAGAPDGGESHLEEPRTQAGAGVGSAAAAAGGAAGGPGVGADKGTAASTAAQRAPKGVSAGAGLLCGYSSSSSSDGDG